MPNMVQSQIDDLCRTVKMLEGRMSDSDYVKYINAVDTVFRDKLEKGRLRVKVESDRHIDAESKLQAIYKKWDEIDDDYHIKVLTLAIRAISHD